MYSTFYNIIFVFNLKETELQTHDGGTSMQELGFEIRAHGEGTSAQALSIQSRAHGGATTFSRERNSFPPVNLLENR